MIVSREKFNIMKVALKMLRKWVIYIRKEHIVFSNLKSAYEELRSKLVNHDSIIYNIESASRIREN
jgi:hypothetical protein